MAITDKPLSEPEDEPVSEGKSVDWRTRTVTYLAEDVPAAYPGGPAHRAGALVVQATSGRDAKGRNVGFTTPSAVALALSLAMKAAKSARELQQQIQYSENVSPFGVGTSVTQKTTPALFDYFEQCMTVLAFGFQALEAYCNETISAKVAATYELTRKKDVLKLTADKLERVASTEEKLGTILPSLLGIPSPKGSRIWNEFLELKRARDATIHIKSRDSNPKIRQPSDLDDATLFHQFLNANISAWVRAAVAMIDYFASQNVSPPWLEHVKDTLGVRTKQPTTNQTKRNQEPRGQRSKTATG